MQCVGVGEDVMCCFPVGVLVGITEARQAERRSVGERSAEVSRSGAGADRPFQCPNDFRCSRVQRA